MSKIKRLFHSYIIEFNKNKINKEDSLCLGDVKNVII